MQRDWSDLAAHGGGHHDWDPAGDGRGQRRDHRLRRRPDIPRRDPHPPRNSEWNRDHSVLARLASNRLHNRHRGDQMRSLRRHRRYGLPNPFPLRGLHRCLRGGRLARCPPAHALRWISSVPLQVREPDRLRHVALAAHTPPLPVAPAAHAVSFPAAGPHPHTAIARSLPATTSTGSAPQLVLAGIATAVAISFNIMLPVVPVLLERGGPHGAAGAGTAWASRSSSPSHWSRSSRRQTGAGVPSASSESP